MISMRQESGKGVSVTYEAITRPGRRKRGLQAGESGNDEVVRLAAEVTL